MIRTPSNPVIPCACGTCPTCTDPLVTDWAADKAERRNRWRTVDLGKGAGRRAVAVGSLAARQALVNPPRPVPPVDVLAFEAHMAGLHERLRSGHG